LRLRKQRSLLLRKIKENTAKTASRTAGSVANGFARAGSTTGLAVITPRGRGSSLDAIGEGEPRRASATEREIQLQQQVQRCNQQLDQLDQMNLNAALAASRAESGQHSPTAGTATMSPQVRQPSGAEELEPLSPKEEDDAPRIDRPGSRRRCNSGHV